MNAASVIDPLGHSTSLNSPGTYGNELLNDVVTDELGRTTNYTYYLWQYPNSPITVGSTTFNKNFAAFVTNVSKPSGLQTTYNHDARGNVATSVATPIVGSGLTPVTYTANFDVTCSDHATCNHPHYTLDANGNETDYTYDPTTGLVLTKTLPAGQNGVRPQTRYTYAQYSATYYNASGQMAQGSPIWKLQSTSTCMTQTTCSGTADEVRVSYTYDGNLRPATVTTASGNGALSSTVTNTYDPVGNLIAVTRPMGSSNTPTTTVYVYDAARQKIGEIGPAPNSDGHYRATKTSYDLDGRVTSETSGWTNSQSDITFANFTPLEQVAYLYDAAGRKIQENHNAANNTTVTVTQYSYDALDHLICTAVRMNPNVFGSLPASACTLGTQGANGPDRITFRTYDAAGELTQTISGYGTSVAEVEKTSTFTADGLEQTAADGKGNLTTFGYDGLDRLSQVFYPNPSSGTSSSTTDYEQYGYDANSNKTSDRRRDGHVVSMTYDALNREITKTGQDITGVYTAYDLFGRPTIIAYSSLSGSGNSKTYDALGRLTSETTYLNPLSYQYDLAGDRTGITWSDGFGISYDYNVDGEMTAIREAGVTSGIGVLATYQHDDLGRTTTVTRGNGGTSSYGYDSISRLTTLAHSMAGTSNDQSVTFTLTYNPADQILNQGTTNATYDFSPTATSAGYVVNGQNQLTNVAGLAIGYDARGNLNNDGTTTYSYDPLNRLVSNGLGAATAYGPEDQLTAVTQSGTTTQFAYAGANIATEYNSSGQILRRYVPGPGEDQTVVWYEGSSTSDRRWLLEDHHGSVVSITNASGSAMAINTYDEYGMPASGNLGRYQYTGQVWLPEFGLYDYKARIYAPKLGRFMQTDTAGYKDGLNWYDYVHNDPVNQTDPTGNASYLIFRSVAVIGNHGFIVVTNKDGSVRARFSYGPQSNNSSHPGQLVEEQGNPSSFTTEAVWKRAFVILPCSAGRSVGRA